LVVDFSGFLGQREGMKMDLCVAPESDPLSVYRYRDGLYAVDLLTAALSLDFFTWLAGRGSCGLELMEAEFGFARRPLDVMLTLFAANGWVQRGEEWAEITLQGREHLCAGSRWFLGPYYASLHDRPIARDFLQVLKTDKPAGWSGDKAAFDWHRAMLEESFARNFTAAMDCRGVLLVEALGRAVDLGGRRCLLDIGGGSGIYACGMVAANEGLEAVVLDQQPVDRIAAQLIEERGYQERVRVAAGNMFEALPVGCDVHLFSNVLHDWGVEDVRRLLMQSHAALPAGGLLLIHDAFVRDDKAGPLHVAEYSCLLMHSTHGKCYSAAEYGALLREVGFEPGVYQDTVVGRGVLSAVRC